MYTVMQTYRQESQPDYVTVTSYQSLSKSIKTFFQGFVTSRNVCNNISLYCLGDFLISFIGKKIQILHSKTHFLFVFPSFRKAMDSLNILFLKFILDVLKLLWAQPLTSVLSIFSLFVIFESAI